MADLLTLKTQDLEKINRENQLGFSNQELAAISQFYSQAGREPVLSELEMIAQAWSEHTRHKTLNAGYRIQDTGYRDGEKKIYGNLLKETVFAATEQLNKPWVLSAFKDNAGMIELDDQWAVAIKVETHNHPSALDPYGGASTGMGGVIRDILGAGLSAHPIASIDVFCVDPRTPHVLEGLAHGVRDYGNRMGIATVAGLIYHDTAYEGLPLVFCGTVGLIRKDRVQKRGPKAGDRAYLLGGKTGRDGIHGATFSSQKLTDELSRSVVQIGNPILEKKVWDFLVEAGEADLFSSITDLGAGGIACAIWELAESGGLGVKAALDGVALKEPGMEGWEILVSESQERMMISVPAQHQARMEKLLKQFELDFTCLGEFAPGGQVFIEHKGEALVDLPIQFLKEVPKRSFVIATPAAAGGSNPINEIASWRRSATRNDKFGVSELQGLGLRLLASPNIASKERIIRQYDHEVGGRTIGKPLGGPKATAPSDGVVLQPLYDSHKGVVLGLGWQGALAKLDSRAMTLAAFDEALRNVVAAGGDCRRIAALDNYCAGSTGNPKVLAELIAVSETLKEAALAYGVPFVSGKDSLNNTTSRDRDIPTVILVTAMGIVEDIRKCVSVSAKKPGNFIYLIGKTTEELGGSQLAEILKLKGSIPGFDLNLAPKIINAVKDVLAKELACSCHDVSDGGLFTALAEMVLGASVGLDVDCSSFAIHPAASLFSETPSRFVVEVEPSKASGFEAALGGLPCAKIGKVSARPELKIRLDKKTQLKWPAQKLEKVFRGGNR
ncbi:MAG: phosphoribosylformylglycinamidine synthase subunit PurL [Elusimicrobia bacterium]|nr:phosphoribosylformylglycinamidine synthase subunit PurL [Elusimicrobiota bacterium]